MSEQIGKNRTRFTLREVEQATGGTILIGDPEFVVTGVVTDSRAVEPDGLFVALRGEKFDGHEYLRDVDMNAAAVAIIEDVDVWEHSNCFTIIHHRNEDGSWGDIDFASFLARDPNFWAKRKNRSWYPKDLGGIHVPNTLIALGDLARYHRKRFDIPVVGITGSYGKTSTRALLDAALSSKFNTLTSQANFNNEIGVPMTLFQLDETHEAAVIEMGMRGRGQIEYLAKVAEPTIGVITNIGPQHIELLGSVEEIALAKAELVEQLPENGLAILPFDSPFFELLHSKCKCRVVTFGAREGADYRVSQIQISPDGGVEFSVEFGIGAKSQPVVLRLPGVHNALNAAAAFAVAHQMGVEPENIALALESAQLPGARMRVVKAKGGATIIDDCYNAGPDSMRAALQTLLDFPGSGRRVAVLGDMKELGEFSESEHRKIGEFAGQFVELLIAVGSETRPLLNAAVESAKEVENEMEVHWFGSSDEAREEVEKMIQENDVVLVKGSRSVGLESVVEALSK